MGLAMSSAPGQERNKAGKRLAAIDHLLIAGIKQGPAKKRDAINRVLELVPQWTRENCWRRIKQLRNTPELAVPKSVPPRQDKESPRKTRPVGRSSGSPWTAEDDEKLFKLAGYEPVEKDRSAPRPVRPCGPLPTWQHSE